MPGQDPWLLLADVVFGAIGTAALIYGWKQRCWRPLLIGCCLSGLPFFLTNVAIMYVSGSVLCAALYFWRE